MNLIYLHTHDSGKYLDPLQSPIAMPGVESLYSESKNFRNAFSAAPTCSPSRAALLTGRWPHSNGMVGLAHRGFQLNQDSTHLVQLLNQAGYETTLCGVQHVSESRHSIGYRHILGENLECFEDSDKSLEERDALNAALAQEYLADVGNQPFFLSFGLLATHRPFLNLGKKKPIGWGSPPPGVIPDLPESRRDMKSFLQSLEQADGIIGSIVESLKRHGYWENTMVLMTTDHGPAFPEMKASLYDGGIGVAMSLRIPGIADDGSLEEALVSQVDVLPTLCDVLNLPKPENLDGENLLPLLRGDSRSVRKSIFAETNYHASYEASRCLRTKGYKLIRHQMPISPPLPSNVDDSPTKTLLKKAGYFEKVRPQMELFDLILDPMERSNLFENKEYQGVRERLVGELDKWMISTGDPLIHGNVPRPYGSRLNRQDAWSATEDTYE